MSTLNDTDLLMVEREGTQYKVKSESMSSLQETDLLLVERDDVSYKIEAKYVSKGNTGSMESPVEVLTPFNGAGLNEGDPYQPVSSEITYVGGPGSKDFSTDGITSIAPGPTWNQDKVWSSLTNFAGNEYDGRGGYMFDSNFSNSGGSRPNDFTAFFSELPATTTVDGIKIRMWTQSTASATFSLSTGNYVLTSFQGGRDDNPLEWTIPCPIGTVLTKLQISGGSTGDDFKIYSLSIDDKPLVDKGATGDPGFGKKLTFISNNNFDKFGVGDEVEGFTDYILLSEQEGQNLMRIGTGYYRGSAITNEETPTTTEVVNTWNPEKTFARKYAVSDQSFKMEFFFADPATNQKYDVPANTDIVIKSELLAGGQYGQFYIKFADGSTESYSHVTDDGNGTLPSPVLPLYSGKFGTGPSYLLNRSKSVRSIMFSGTGTGITPQLQAIMVDNKVHCLASALPTLSDPNFASTPNQIIEIDPAGPTWLTDGGEYETNQTFTKTVDSEAVLTFTDDTELAKMIGPISQSDADGNTEYPVTTAITSITPPGADYYFVSDTSTGLPNEVDLTSYSGDDVLNVLTIQKGENGVGGQSCRGTEPGYGGVGGNQGYVYLAKQKVSDYGDTITYNPARGGSTVLANPTQTTDSVSDRSPGQPGGQGTNFSVPEMPELTFSSQGGGQGGNATGSRGGGGNGGAGGIKITSSLSDFPVFTTPVAGKGGDGQKKGGNRQGFGGYGGTGFGAGGGGGAGSAEDQGSCGYNGAGGAAAHGLNIIQLPFNSTYYLTDSTKLNDFAVGDTVTSGTSTGVVSKVDIPNSFLQIAFDVEPAVGDTITGVPYTAGATDVIYVSGSNLGVSGISGTWLTGLHAKGATVSVSAPSPSKIQFTSMNGGTTPFTGKDASITNRIWELDSGNSPTGPWTKVGSFMDFSIAVSQDGATPWEDHPVVEPNKFYQVRVTYDSNNADSETSTFHTFKTGVDE